MNDKIFIIGYYGWKNVGDDSMLYCLVREIIKIDSIKKISILSQNHVALPLNKQVKFVFVKPSFYNLSKEMLSSSRILIGGGTHLTDYGDRASTFKRLLRIFILSIYAKILHKKIYLLENGIGPFSSLSGSFIARATCFFMDSITVRDRASYSLLRKWGYSRVTLGFDPAVLLNDDIIQSNYPMPEHTKQIVGVSVTPFFSIYYNHPEHDMRMINEIAKTLSEYLKRSDKSEIRLYVFHGESKDDDVKLTRILKEKICAYSKIYTRVKIINYDPDPRKLLSDMRSCNLFVGTKYHSLVFAYVIHLPLLVINYHEKCQAFAEEIKLVKNAVIQPNEILYGGFNSYFESFLENSNSYFAMLPLNQAIMRAKKGIFSIFI